MTGIIQAITSQQTGLNIITEFIVGYMLPGRPIAMMLFKSWGYMLMSNGLTFVQDMKVGHYVSLLISFCQCLWSKEDVMTNRPYHR